MILDYKKHLEDIKIKSGPRYSPKLHVELPISELFDGISKSNNFYTEIRSLKGKLNKKMRWLYGDHENQDIESKKNEIYSQLKILNSELEKIKEYDNKIYPWEQISKYCDVIDELFRNIIDLLNKEKDKVKGIKAEKKEGSGYVRSPSEIIGSEINDTYKVIDIIRKIKDYSNSDKAKLSNNPFLYIKGVAGSGKTHLLCDLLEKRVKTDNSLDTILILGEYFIKDIDFWNQLFNQVKINKLWSEKILDYIGLGNFLQKKRVLKYLNKKGSKNNNRSLIIIDALNENISQAPNFWKNNIQNIIKEVKKYPNIALIVSTRVGFETQIFNKNQEKYFIHTEHQGLKFREWEAVNKFFKEFNLPLPEVPLLMSEFQNPLFLLLFCSAFSNKTITLKNKPKKERRNIKSFRGHFGSTHIFEKFVEHSSKKLCNEFSIDQGKASSPESRIWNNLIKSIAEHLINSNSEKISELKLKEIIEEEFKNIKTDDFIKGLEKNNLLLKTPIYGKNLEIKGYEYKFPFQKFSDFLLTRYIFKKYYEYVKKNKLSKNKETLKDFFSIDNNIGKYLTKSWNYGVVEALSIECPEHMEGVEFLEVAPHLTDTYYEYIYKALIESFIWRLPSAFDSKLTFIKKVINKVILDDESLTSDLLNAFITIGPIVEHPMNGNRLHSWLSKFSMPERDSLWSSNYIRDNYGENGALDRILNWAWSNHNKDHISDESIFLSCIILSWLFTTPNRFVRDRATKGLVTILKDRIDLITPLLEKFKNINDIYIIERIYGSIYGSLLFQEKGKNIDKIEKIGNYIYDEIFKDNTPPEHILLRDYAKCSIKHIINLGASLKINPLNIEPPYISKFIDKYPIAEELEKKYDRDDKEGTKGIWKIWWSVMAGGDFERYIIGTNSHSFYWSGHKLNKTEDNKQDIYNKFKESLNKDQKKLLQNISLRNFVSDDSGNDIDLSKLNTNTLLNIIHCYKDNKEEIEHKKIGNSNNLNISFIDSRETLEEMKQKDKNKVKTSVEKFKKSLNKEQIKIFSQSIEECIDDFGEFSDPDERFNLDNAKSWIFKKVIDLGYSPELHGDYDKNINYYDSRESNKTERIGKKYQWIAYHEFLAKISDHYKFKDRLWSNDDTESPYKGAWHPHIRDIDLSFIIQDDSHIEAISKFNKWNKNISSYDLYKGKKDNLDWIKDFNDGPNFEDLIDIIDDDNNEWLLLEGNYKWEEETPPENDKYDIPIREIWCNIKSYIIKQSDSENFEKWVKKQNFMGRWMPDASSFYEIFLGEYPNSEAFDDIRGDYNIEKEIDDYSQKGKTNVKVIVTDDEYSKESGYDCSSDGGVRIQLPNKWIINKMNLIHKDLNGIFYDSQDNIISFCNGIFTERKPSGLLINKKKFLDFLKKEGYIIYWTLIGEKQMMGGGMSREDFIGRTEFSGSFKIGESEKIIGEIKYDFKK